MQTYSNQEIDRLVWIGFCQPKFYKQSVWRKAKALMDLACDMNIGVEYRPVRGAGHYWTARGEDEVKIESVIWALVQKYGNPISPFITKQYGERYRIFNTEIGLLTNGDYCSIEEADKVAEDYNSSIRVLPEQTEEGEPQRWLFYILEDGKAIDGNNGFDSKEEAYEDAISALKFIQKQ
jgi:hypothetical protein